MISFKRYLFFAGAGVVMALIAWSLSERPWAQAKAQSQPTVFDLERRIATLEKENQEDYRAIRDLYQRIQNLEQQMNRAKSDFDQRIQSLSQEDNRLREQMTQSQETLIERRRKNVGYPMVRSIRQDRSGNMIIDYE